MRYSRKPNATGKMRTVLIKYRPSILGVSDIMITYRSLSSIDEPGRFQFGMAKVIVKADIILHPDKTIREANEIAAHARDVILKHIDYVLEVDIDLELSERADGSSLPVLFKEEQQEITGR
jgi:hypothetical protein